ncbi:MAG: hydrogenase nickel incorporation protein HypB [Promethearchaeota archaeon]
MTDQQENDIKRIQELESTNLARDEIREEVIETKLKIQHDNDLLAKKNNEILQKHEIKSFDFVGAIGAGKTALLERICEELSSRYRILVICGDITTRLDANRIEEYDAETIQINTGRECALNAYHIHQIISNKELDDYDVIFIENVGNLICPSDFILGTDKRITIVSITEGEWVVEKHPMLFEMSDIAVINKIDLIGRLGTNLEKMIQDAKKFNPKIQVIPTSAKTKKNLEILIEALGL